MGGRQQGAALCQR